MRTIHLLVSCVREHSRKMMLNSVVESFIENDHFPMWKNDFYTFDNGSTCEGVDEILSKLEGVIYRAKQNYGYWSAINWFINEVATNDDLVHIIESDSVHFDIQKLDHATKALIKDHSIGMIRTQEFSVENRHLYDKRRSCPESRTTEWCVQRNTFTNDEAWFVQTEFPFVWETNMVAKACGLHRVSSLRSVMSSLPEKFNEVEFQKSYFNRAPKNGLIDGGIFHTRLSYGTHDGKKVVASSLIEGSAGTLDEHGYMKTRDGFLHSLDKMSVRS